MKKRITLRLNNIENKALGRESEQQIKRTRTTFNHLNVKLDHAYSHYKSKVRNTKIENNLYKLIGLAKQYHMRLFFYYVVPSMQNSVMQDDNNDKNDTVHKLNHIFDKGYTHLVTRNNQNPYHVQTNAYRELIKKFKKINRKNRSYIYIANEHQETNTDATQEQFNVHDNLLIVSTRPYNPEWLNTFIHDIYHQVSGLKVKSYTRELGYQRSFKTTMVCHQVPKFVHDAYLQPVNLSDEKQDIAQAVNYMTEDESQLPSVKHLSNVPDQLKDLYQAEHLGLLGKEMRAILNSQSGDGIRLMHQINFKSMKHHILQIVMNTDDLGFYQKEKVRTENGITTGVLKFFKLKKHKFKGNLSKFFKRKRIKTRQHKWNQLVTTIISKFNNDSTVKHSPKLVHVYSAADNNKLSVKHRQRGENQSHMHCQTQNCKRWEADQLNTHTQHFRIWGSKGSLDNQTMNINLVAGGLNFQTQEQYLGAELSYGLAVHSMARPKGEKSTANLLQLWRLKPT